MIALPLGGLFALALTAYAILFIVNLDDRPPTADISALKSLQDPASPIASENNAYLYMLGFSGPPDVDPMTLGLERYGWMQTARPEFDLEDDPLDGGYDFHELRNDAVAKLAKSCSASEVECLRVLESSDEAVELWLSSESALLNRYRVLLSMTEFSEAMSSELLAPQPQYNVMFEGQLLHILSAWQLATEADAQAVMAALNRDLIYWRMVLERSSILLTKMMATAAINRHFALGNIVLRRLPNNVAAEAIPASWRTAISANERFMKRSFAGEWAFFDELSKRIVANSENPFDYSMALTDATAWDQAKWVMLKPFWQPQDLSNRHARLMLDLGNTLDVGYDDIAHAAGLADELQNSAFRPYRRLYNFTGDLIMSADFSNFSGYAVRVSDLEGIRRAGLLVALLRAAGTRKEDVVDRLVDSEIVDPYTNEPFTWSDQDDAVVFRGLAPHQGSHQHKLIF